MSQTYTAAPGDASDIAAITDTLARTLWGEARGEGPRGMSAVASVILNRVVRPGWWGRDIVTICRAPFQFSCWLENDPNRAKLMAVTTADPAYDAARAIARLAVTGGLADITGGADSYYADGSTAPQWAKGLQPVAVIGRHRFYRLLPRP